MAGDQTLSYVGSDDLWQKRSFVAPYVVVGMQCHQPLELPARFSIGEVDQVVLGRADERGYERRGQVLKIVVIDGWMSSNHATLRKELGGWVLRDNGSKNGTFVNGTRADGHRLRDGDVVECGRTLFYFRDAVRREFGDASDVSPDALRTAVPGLATLSVPMQRVIDQVTRVATAPIPVMVLGPTGTGKEVFARALHQLSERKGDFVPVNCGAMPENLLEAELFGAKKGAYSGAGEDRPGLVRAADGGTLFLDEIAEMSPSSQVALLRVLQEHEVRAVGDTRSVKVDIRVIAATHQDLDRRVADGSFREDLFARLAGLTVSLPPLCERLEDLGLLVSTLLPRVSPRALTIERAAGRALFAYAWPRNVRELEQTLRTAAALTDDGEIRMEHLPPAVQQALVEVGRKPPPPPEDSPEDEELRARLTELLAEHDGNVSAVARELGKLPAQIYRWCKRLGLDPKSYR